VIVDCAVYHDGRRADLGGSVGEAVAACRTSGEGYVWIGLYEPTAEELAQAAEEFDLHPLAVEDAVHAHQRPKLEVYGSSVFVVLRTATYLDHEEVIDLGELMAFVGDHFLVTVRHGRHSGLAGLRHRLEDDPERLARGPTAVLHALVDLVVDER
jgi:magnesium transporter